LSVGLPPRSVTVNDGSVNDGMGLSLATCQSDVNPAYIKADSPIALFHTNTP